MSTLAKIEEEALRLSPEDRESLADVLVQSLENAPGSDVDAAWIEEAERRYEQWRAGKTEGIPEAKFFADLRRELGWR